MSRTPRLLNQRNSGALILPICLILSACGGGGGGGIASIPPPPPTPTPTPAVASIEVQTSWLPSPATNARSYGVIGLLNETTNGVQTSRFTVPGEFQLYVSSPNAGGSFGYSLGTPSDFLPAELDMATLPVPAVSWIFNPGGPNFRVNNPYEDYPQFFGQNLKEYEVYPDGSKKLREDYDFRKASVPGIIVDLPSGQRIGESLLFDIGLSYVAMGEWSWSSMVLNADGSSTSTGDKHSIYFAYGDRTAGSALPVSGTATYDARALSKLSSNVAFRLTADFGHRTMSTQIDQNYRYNPSGDIMDDPLAVGIHVSGTSPFSNDGSFDIPLAGTANYGTGYALNTPDTPVSQPVTGSMNGAFFGPHAQQVGGVFAVNGPGGVAVLQDAFVGQQREP